MSSESPVEGERGLGLRGVPRGVGHAVAPGVEMGLLDDGLVLVQDLFPAAEVVGEHVVEALRAAVVDMHGHNPSLGVDVVEPAGS